MYPSQNFINKENKEYFVHTSENVYGELFSNYKSAKYKYDELTEKGIDAMITKTTTTEITLVKREHVAGKI